LRSGYQAYRQRSVDIGPAVHDPAAYDLVMIGTPIWNMSVAPPVRSYLVRERARLPAVAFFCTCGGRGGERAFAQMARECGKAAATTLIVRESELARSGPTIAKFVGDTAEAPSPKNPQHATASR
jgi:hypothetical protein